jgi:hypothetical protein
VAIKQIREVPTKLPAAHLFLDDVEELSEIIFRIPSRFGDDGPKPSLVRYTVGGDRTCDSVGDLKKIGGKTEDFSIEADNGTLSISSFNSSFRSHGHREDAWKAYGKVRAVFEHRKIGALHYLRQALFVVPWFLPVVIVWRFPAVPSAYSYSFEIVYWVVLGIMFGRMVGRHSIVELRYFDEAKNERFKEMRPAIWAAIISAILGGVITVIGERIVKWLWP